jgi:Calcineurin-like phosphoesterase
MRIFKTLLALALALGVAGMAAARDDAFTFVAFADTAYEPPGDYALYEKLLAVINAAKPSFSMHLGDTKGYGACDEEAQARQRDFFNTLDAPLVYAPGNNEWSECWRPEMGGADPVETLGVLRKVFYPDGFSLGKTRMAVEREAAGEDYGATPENSMWEKNGILFVALNVNGSGNNLVNLNEKMFAEFLSRDKANQAWIERAFARVESEHLKGVVFGFHSSLWLGTAEYRAGPFERVINALKKGASETEAQVLIVNGHAHAFIVDKPWQAWDNAAKTFAFGNVMRLQVPGWPEHKAVEVTVEPKSPSLWSFREIFDPDNLSQDFRTPNPSGK